MSYCRFHNTVLDLKDCYNVLSEQGLDGTDEYGELLSLSEFNNAKRLIEICRKITEMFGDEELEDIVYPKIDYEDN
jgi:hypothetical protein